MPSSAKASEPKIIDPRIREVQLAGDRGRIEAIKELMPELIEEARAASRRLMMVYTDFALLDAFEKHCERYDG